MIMTKINENLLPMKIVNNYSTSTQDGYSCNYVNEVLDDKQDGEWKLLATGVGTNTSVDLTNIDFTELWCVVRMTSDTQVAVSQLIVKQDLTSTSKKYRNGFYYTSGFNCGVSFNASTSAVFFNDFYENGAPVNSTMNVYYR